MKYRTIDMDAYPRRDHFQYFKALAFPYVGLTVNVDITGLPQSLKARKLPFFLTVCYCVDRAANGVAEFRQRIVHDRIIELDRCRASYTVALPDGTYCYCDLDCDLPLEDYIPFATKAQEEAMARHSIEETEEEALDKFFISTIPWVSFTALTHPAAIPADSNPRITWGKFFSQGDRVLLPVSVQCHHALVDGLHIARFYELLDKEISSIIQGNPEKP